jgi:hypothetical protein
MSVVTPTIEGKKEAPKEEEQKEKQQVEVEQNSQLSIGAPLPSEEELPSRDIAGATPLKQLAETHKVVEKKMMSEKQQAGLSNARKALAEKRRREKAEGRNGAQGTPVPDYLTEFSNQMNVKFEQVLKALHDVQNIRPFESSRQGIDLPSDLGSLRRVNVPTAQPDESIPVPVNPRRYERYPDLPPVQPEVSYVPRMVPAQNEYFSKKYKQMNENVEFYDQDVRQRATQDASMGKKPTVQDKVVLF